MVTLLEMRVFYPLTSMQDWLNLNGRSLCMNWPANNGKNSVISKNGCAMKKRLGKNTRKRCVKQQRKRS